jgi:IclR family transcriptional regulator, acetate operon repressor
VAGKLDPEAAAERDVSGPRSLTRLLALFDALSSAPDGLSLTELSTLLESPKSSLLNLLRPLVSEAYLIHNAGLYLLGPSIFRLASGVLDSWYLPKSIHPLMTRLAASSGESVMLSVMDAERGMQTYVDVVDSPHPVRYQISVGTVRPLYASTGGRLLLAYADRQLREQYLGQVEITVRTAIPITKTSLRRDLEQIRRDGVASSVDGYMVGLSAVAAPILDPAGRCVACLNIAGPTDRFEGNLPKLRETVRSVAEQASAALRLAEPDPMADQPGRRTSRAA